jgi:RNA polymerase sigma-70 factor, ECF subfamily
MSQRSKTPHFDTIFAEHAPFVWRVLRRMGVADADLEDVCQEVFVVVHRRLAEFEFRSQIRTWIFAICRRVARAHWNRAYHRRELLSDAPPEIAVSAEQSSAIEKQQLTDRLDSILSQLTEAKRMVYILYEIEEIPMAEIAEMVGCPLHTAFSRLYAARREVESALERRILQRKVV